MGGDVNEEFKKRNKKNESEEWYKLQCPKEGVRGGQT